MLHNKKLIFIGFILLSIISIGYDFSLRKTSKVEDTNNSSSLMYVTLEGEFNITGQYTFKENDTIQTIIDNVGVKEDANLDALTLDKKLEDEESIYLPVKNDDCVNINTANSEELMTLERVGEKTAEKIITYRETQPFTKIEELMDISGIGEKTFINLRDHVCL